MLSKLRSPEVCNGGISDKLQCQRLQVVSGGGTFLGCLESLQKMHEIS